MEMARQNSEVGQSAIRSIAAENEAMLEELESLKRRNQLLERENAEHREKAVAATGCEKLSHENAGLLARISDLERETEQYKSLAKAAESRAADEAAKASGAVAELESQKALCFELKSQVDASNRGSAVIERMEVLVARLAPITESLSTACKDVAGSPRRPSLPPPPAVHVPPPAASPVLEKRKAVLLTTLDGATKEDIRRCLDELFHAFDEELCEQKSRDAIQSLKTEDELAEAGHKLKEVKTNAEKEVMKVVREGQEQMAKLVAERNSYRDQYNAAKEQTISLAADLQTAKFALEAQVAKCAERDRKIAELEKKNHASGAVEPPTAMDSPNPNDIQMLLKRQKDTIVAQTPRTARERPLQSNIFSPVAAQRRTLAACPLCTLQNTENRHTCSACGNNLFV